MSALNETRQFRAEHKKAKDVDEIKLDLSKDMLAVYSRPRRSPRKSSAVGSASSPAASPLGKRKRLAANNAVAVIKQTQRNGGYVNSLTEAEIRIAFKAAFRCGRG